MQSPLELSTLADLQDWMSGTLMRPAEGESEATRAVRPSRTLAPAEALGIYRNMMCVRFEQTMAEAYPGVQKAVGRDEFGRLVRSYLRAFPPRSFTLARLGDRFSLYLSRRDRLPWLSELAELEHAAYELADLPDQQSLAPAGLTRVADAGWGNVRLVPIRGLRLMNVEYNVQDLYAAARSGAPLPSPTRREARLVLYLRAGRVELLPVSEGAAELLRALIRGAPLAAAIEQALVGAGEPEPALIFEWMRDWASRGLFHAIIPS